MNIRIKTYATVTALGADAIVSGGYLYLTGFEPMLVKGIKPTSIVVPVTQQLAVWTGVVTAANSTSFQINLGYVNKLTGANEFWNSVAFTSDSTGTRTEVATNMMNQVNNMSATIPVVATLTGSGDNKDLVLTALTGYAVFTAASIGTSVITFTNGTAGIPAVGLGSQLKYGNFTDSTLVDASYYYQVVMNYNNRSNVGSAQESTVLVNKAVLYVLSTATNIASLVGTYGSLTYALAGNGLEATVTCAASSTMAYAQSTGILTMTGGAGTWSSQGIKVGDLLYIDSAPTVPLPVMIQTTNLLGVSVIGLNGAADISAGAYKFRNVSAD